MHSGTTSLFLAAALLLPVPLAGQWMPDLNARRLAWGNANVVIRSDTVSGVQIWAATSRTHRMDTPRRQFAARFDPDSIVNWLAYAQLVLSATAPPPDATALLKTPTLMALDRSRLSLVREQKGGKWSSRIQLRFATAGGKEPWGISAQLGEAAVFLSRFFEAAGRSSYLADAVLPLELNPADSATCPQPLSTPVLLYPLNRIGESGDVWLTFVVKANSTVDQTSIRVVISDGLEFTAAAVRAITSVRYRPASTNAGVRDALAFQRVAFTMSSDSLPQYRTTVKAGRPSVF